MYHVRLRLHLDLEAMDQRAGLLLAPLGRGFGVVPGELVVQGRRLLAGLPDDCLSGQAPVTVVDLLQRSKNGHPATSNVP